MVYKTMLTRQFKTIAILFCLILLMLSLPVEAQNKRIPCDRGLRLGISQTRGTRASQSFPVSTTDTIHVPVILISFPDQGWSLSDADTFKDWDDKLNLHDYSENGAHGCVADYFREQSGGKFNVVFDVMGPFVAPQKMAFYGRNKNEDDENPEQLVEDACVAAGIDFSPYDMDNDKTVDLVTVIFAGQGENNNGPADAIWPHFFYAYGKSVGGLKLGEYIILSEMFTQTERNGHGTFCHEFSHTLGLPDLYPIDASPYSLFDEWDLMDGGNYINKGYSPPNYSAHERYLCGWLDFETLTEPISITDMPSMDEEPRAYKIVNDAFPNEYYILENRQQRGYDSLIPGNGLLVTHITNYNKGDLFPNSNNNFAIKLVAADNRGYDESRALSVTQYDEYGRSNYLRYAAYPYVTDTLVNNSLTDYSVPAAVLNLSGESGSKFLSKPITNIQMDAAGHISFDFMQASGVGSISAVTGTEPVAYYDLSGRMLPGIPNGKGVYIVQYADGRTQKMVR